MADLTTEFTKPGESNAELAQWLRCYVAKQLPFVYASTVEKIAARLERPATCNPLAASTFVATDTLARAAADISNRPRKRTVARAAFKEVHNGQPGHRSQSH